jgi:hypothetical protein
MFPALLTHPQKGLHKRHLVCCVRVKSVGCTNRIGGADQVQETLRLISFSLTYFPTMQKESCVL